MFDCCDDCGDGCGGCGWLIAVAMAVVLAIQ